MATKIIDPNSGNRILDVLKHNPSLFYKEEVFRQTCEDLDIQDCESLVGQLGSTSTVADMIDVVPEKMRGHFLKLYVCHFGRVLVV